MVSRPHTNQSYSRLNTASGCMRRYAAEALSPRFAASPAMEKGTDIHSCLEAVSRRMLAGEGPVSALEAVMDAPPVRFIAPDVARDYLARCSDLVLRFRPTEVEREFRFPLGGVVIRGRIDFVGEELAAEQDVVLDYKVTGSPATVKDYADSRRSLQLHIYALATGITRVGYVWLLPRGAPEVVLVDLAPEALRVTELWLRDQSGAIDAMWGATRGLTLDDIFAEHSPWPLAARDYIFCSQRACPFWGRCVGRGLSAEKTGGTIEVSGGTEGGMAKATPESYP